MNELVKSMRCVVIDWGIGLCVYERITTKSNIHIYVSCLVIRTDVHTYINALRCINAQPSLPSLCHLPLFCFVSHAKLTYSILD
jgi:hypothetical protein